MQWKFVPQEVVPQEGIPLESVTQVIDATRRHLTKSDSCYVKLRRIVDRKTVLTCDWFSTLWC